MLILVFLLYIFFASTFTFSKAVLSYGRPIFFIAIRMMSAGILLLLYDYFFSQKQLIVKKSKGLFIQFILFAIYFAFVFEFIGLVHVTSAKACLLYNLSPFITALFSYFIFKESLTKIQWLGLFIGFIGFLPVLMAQQPFETLVDHFLSLPELLVIFSTIAASYGWIVMKELMINGYSAIFINGIGMFGGGVLALITSLIWEKAPRVFEEKNISFLLKIFPTMSPEIVGFIMFGWYTLLLILVGNIISYNLYGYLLTRYSATFLSFAGFTTPLFAALFGWFFLDEQVSWQFFLTVIIVFVGLYLFYKDELPKKIKK